MVCEPISCDDPEPEPAETPPAPARVPPAIEKIDGPRWLQVLHYLEPYNPEHQEYVAPPDVTQARIAEALGMSRAHGTLVLGRLTKRGLVKGSLTYIEGGKRRQLAYSLTRGGLTIVRRLD